jgi:hypothetical protein
MSYIILNLVYLHPETWEAEGRGKWMARKERLGLSLRRRRWIIGIW